MILNQHGQNFIHGHTCLYIGQKIVANADSVYAGLEGIITSIIDDADKESENPGIDIYCDFALPKSASLISQLERRFSLFAEDIPLEDIIMSPDMIEPKGQFQINAVAQPLYVLTYTMETDDDFNCFVIGVSLSIDALKEQMLAHIKENPSFAGTDIIASDDYCVCEYDVMSVPDDRKRHVLTVEKDDNYYKYVISETPYISQSSGKKEDDAQC